MRVGIGVTASDEDEAGGIGGDGDEAVGGEVREELVDAGGRGDGAGGGDFAEGGGAAVVGEFEGDDEGKDLLGAFGGREAGVFFMGDSPDLEFWGSPVRPGAH